MSNETFRALGLCSFAIFVIAALNYSLEWRLLQGRDEEALAMVVVAIAAAVLGCCVFAPALIAKCLDASMLVLGLVALISLDTAPRLLGGQQVLPRDWLLFGGGLVLLVLWQFKGRHLPDLDLDTTTSIRLARYFAAVTIVYIAIFLGLLFATDYFHAPVLRPEMVVMTVIGGAFGLAAMLTFGPIWRHGSRGGSVFFVPTVLHIAMAVIIGLAFLSV